MAKELQKENVLKRIYFQYRQGILNGTKDRVTKVLRYQED
jgi:hypothetical protein